MRDNPKSKLYLYLARRDKKEIRILAIFQGHAVPPTRVNNIQNLGLPKNLSSKIKAAIHNDRLLWEPWIEAAESFDNLRNSLKNRGYKTPRRSKTQFATSDIIESNVRGLDKSIPAPNVHTDRIPLKKTMLGG